MLAINSHTAALSQDDLGFLVSTGVSDFVGMKPQLRTQPGLLCGHDDCAEDVLCELIVWIPILLRRCCRLPT